MDGRYGWQMREDDGFTVVAAGGGLMNLCFDLSNRKGAHYQNGSHEEWKCLSFEESHSHCL